MQETGEHRSQMKRPHVVLGLLVILIGLVGFEVCRESRLTKKEARIAALLQQDSRFPSIRVEYMKPGWHRIAGNVGSSNALFDLKQMLQTNNIRKCAFAVEIK